MANSNVVTKKQPMGGSKIGRSPIPVPAGVELTLNEKSLSAKGPKGELECSFNEYISLEIKDNFIHVTTSELFSKKGKSYHGLFAKLIQNTVTGVSVGFTKSLLLVGTGYRAKLNDGMLELSLGYSHPVVMDIPKGIACKVEDNSTRIILESINKEELGQFAADIKKKRKPEPYKGKGIRYADEVIKKKAGKAGKSK